MPDSNEKREVEYGVSYPDGTTRWFSSFSGTKVDTPEGRSEMVAERNKRLALDGVPKDAGLVFFSREVITTYTTPERVVD